MMGAVVRPARTASILSLMLACGVAIPSLASASEDLIGYWRPQFAGTPTPDLSGCAPEDDQCTQHQGMYQRDVYLQIDQANGKAGLVMLSDGTLHAKLTPRKGNADAFDVTFGKDGKASLLLKAPDCKGVGACFQIDGSTDTSVLDNDIYVPMVLRKPGDPKERKDGDNFSRVPANFDLAGRCYDITKMDMEDFQLKVQCKNNIFYKLDDFKDTADYYVTNDGKSQNITVPFGWSYVPLAEGSGSTRTRIIESEQDLVESQSQTIGRSTGLNLFVVDFSYNTNETTQSRVEKMSSDSLTYSQFEYHETNFAYVLDKANARLDPGFYQLVAKTLRRQKDPDFGDLIDKFGTHYSFATTMGASGRLFSTMTTDDVMSLHEQGINITTGAAGGVSIPTEAGNAGTSGGVSTGQSSSETDKMSNLLGGNFGTYKCFGGVSCDGVAASGEDWVPILLDLRPLSDLLGPPFFPEIPSAELRKLKKGLSKAIKDYAFTETGASKNPAAQFLRVATEPDLFGNRGLWIECTQSVEGTDPMYDEFNNNGGNCASFDDITLVDEKGNIMTYGPQNSANKDNPTPSDPGLIVTPGSEITLSTTITRWALDCSIDANNAMDQSAYSGLATGKGTVPAQPQDRPPNEYLPGVDPPSMQVGPDQGWMTIPLTQTNCDEEAGGAVVKGGGWAFLYFDPVRAADLIQH